MRQLLSRLAVVAALLGPLGLAQAGGRGPAKTPEAAIHASVGKRGIIRPADQASMVNHNNGHFTFGEVMQRTPKGRRQVRVSGTFEPTADGGWKVTTHVTPLPASSTTRPKAPVHRPTRRAPSQAAEAPAPAPAVELSASARPRAPVFRPERSR